MRAEPPARLSRADVLAGISVALILIPQSMAYAELAGLPPHHGLYAAALPTIVAAFFASSPYLQGGPVALSSLLTLGALVPLGAPIGSPEFVSMAALLALIVGVGRLILGLLRAGWVVYLMSHSMMTGFLLAAAILILSSQLPGAFGVSPPSDLGVLQRAWAAVSVPGAWETTSVVLTLFTIGMVMFSGRIHPLIPGVLVAAAVGLLYSVLTGYTGNRVGAIPEGLPRVSLDLPWASLPALLIPGIVISVIGFAEGVSISRLFASEERQRWNANREFVSQGMACIASGLSAGFPVGGSLSRSSVNRLAGARSRWSGLVTGVVVLGFLPFASILAPLPRAVLAGIVIAAVVKLIRPERLWAIWRVSPAQAVVGTGTFVATLALAPNIERGILVGLALSGGVHLWRELTPKVKAERMGDKLRFELSGVMWFGSAPAFEDLVFARVAEDIDVRRIEVSCAGLGRIDLSGAYTLGEMSEAVRRAGIEVEFLDIPDHAVNVLGSVGIIGPRATRATESGET